MRAVVATVFVLALGAFAVPALAQDPTGVVTTGVSALQIILQQGITGAIAVVCLIGFIFKDRQITKERDVAAEKLAKERDVWMEKIVTLALNHAADNAKSMALMERITQLMERIARYFEKAG